MKLLYKIGLIIIIALIVSQNIFPQNDGKKEIINRGQQIDLFQGYGFISSYTIPENPDILIVMASVLNENLDFVRNSQGQTIRKIGPNWVNGIGEWIIAEGYLVKMFADDSFVVSGDLVDPSTPIQLESGFQFISFIIETQVDALIAFETILGDDLDFVRNSQGQIIRKIGPNWVNGIGNCKPGEGYLIKMYSDDILIYPAANQPPELPSSPCPGNGTENQSTETYITWTCSDPDGDPLNYDIYFGTEIPLSQFATDQTETVYDPGTLDYNTEYFWKIVAHDDHNNSTEGVVWSFITESEGTQWQQTSGPTGGYVRSIIFDGFTTYAATGGGVLASDDNGNSWSSRNNGLESCDTKSFAKLGEYIFVSTDENVFRTNDHGMTWEAAGEEMNGKYTKSLVVCNDVLFAGTYLRGIYRSTDNGNTWSAVNNGLPAKYIYYLETDGNNIFAGTYLDGLFRSTDMGDNWTSINTGLTEANIMAIICFENKVFLSTLSSGVFVSANNGNTWAPLGTNIPSVKGFTHFNGILYAASFGGGVYRSLDSGLTWTTINSGLGETNIWAIGTNDSKIFVGVTSGHIYNRNISGGNWILSSNSGFYACTGSLSSSGSNLLAGTHGSGFYTSNNNGASWTKVGSIWTVETRAIISSGSTVFAGTDMLGVFKSTNGGNSFSMVNNGLNSAWIQAFTICSNKLFAGSGEEGVFITSNGGSNWSAVNSGLGSLNILSLASDGTNVFAGTSETGVYITSDLGLNWTSVNNGLNSSCITSIQFVDGYLFAGTKNAGIFVSSDQGANWSPASYGIPSQANIRCLHNHNNIVFAGTGDGDVFASLDYGNNWIMLSSGLNFKPVLSLWVYNDYLYAGMNAGGVWKYPLSEI